MDNVLAMSRAVQQTPVTYERFCRELASVRYRDAVVNGYASRLHYFCDWVWDASRRGLITDLTKELGGKVNPKVVSFMTQNPQYYPSLSDPVTYAAIKAAEDRLNATTRYRIEEADIASSEAGIRDGDIIALTFSKPGLVIAHVGFAVRVHGRVHLLHASSDLKKVVVSDQTVEDMIRSSNRFDGMMVMRPIAPQSDIHNPSQGG